jgi:hypothetical protein
MAALSAFIELRQYLSKNPGLDVATAVKSVRVINPNADAFDYIGGIAINELLGPTFDSPNTVAGLRPVIFELVRRAQPWWLRLVPYGREKVRANLGQDQVQCFREVGLFDAIPDVETVAWWDELAAAGRATVEVERMSQARYAEQMSLDHERERLLQLDIKLEPEWVSLEDNTLGYDIRSYDLSDGQVVSRLIEVKSTTADRIFITRNQWDNAASAQPHFCFHVWKLPERSVTEYSVTRIRSHIPADMGQGLWEEVRIDLSGI